MGANFHSHRRALVIAVARLLRVPGKAKRRGLVLCPEALMILQDARLLILAELDTSHEIEGIRKRLSAWRNYRPSVAREPKKAPAAAPVELRIPKTPTYRFASESFRELRRLADRVGVPVAGNR